MRDTEDRPAGAAADDPPRGGVLARPGWLVVAAFGTYFCTYGYRKPFTAGTYADADLWGAGAKGVLVAAQVLGYALSKFVGIKVVAEASAGRRAALILGLIGAAQAALLLFALTPMPWAAGWLFANGLPLGMVFGLVLGALEGRRQTEALAAGLCASFIMADGVTKSVGAVLLGWGVPEAWMPCAAGLVFAPPLALFVALLARAPAPTAADVAARSERQPMDGRARRAFFRRYAPGLALLVLAYTLVTVLRSARADFAPEIWAGLGEAVRPGLFTWSEAAVAACVLAVNGAAVLIRDNRRAFSYALLVAVLGSLVVAGALAGLRAGALTPLAFMVAVGVGLYLPYIAVHTTVFERLIAMTRDRGNIGYLMYLADSFGYLGYVAVLLARGVLGAPADFLAFFLPLCGATAAACAALFLPCWVYFVRHGAVRAAAPTPPAPAAVGGG